MAGRLNAPSTAGGYRTPRAGEPLSVIARTYGVAHTTIARLQSRGALGPVIDPVIEFDAVSGTQRKVPR